MKSLIKKVFRRKLHNVQNETLVGYSVRDGERSPLRLSPEQLRGHSVIFGSTGMGKTALMGHLACAVMNSPFALIVIDMDGDLVPHLVGQVPVNRVEDVGWIDLNNKDWVPGFNLLELGRGEDAEFILANLVHTARGLWGAYWKPDVEEALRISVRTLLAANRVLAQRNEPQFGLLDVLPLFERPDFCRRLLGTFVTEPDLLEWWKPYVERPSWLNMYDFAALLTPLRNLQLHRHASNIIGQPNSTFDLREFLAPGRITLFNMRSDALDTDMRRWLAALIVDRVNLLTLRRERIASECQLPGIVVAVNGELSIPRLSEPTFLADLQEHGLSYILTNWSAPYPEAGDPGLRRAIPANAANLFVFRTSRSDADILSRELGGAASALEIFNQPRYACLVRMETEHSGVVAGQMARATWLGRYRRAVKSVPRRIMRHIRKMIDFKAYRKGLISRRCRNPIARLRRFLNMLLQKANP